MNKRGISTIIFTMVMITLVLFAVGIVWGVVQNILSEGTEDISLSRFTIGVDVQSAKIEGNNVVVGVIRKVGKGNLTGIKFVFFDGENSEAVEREVSLGELESKSFTFTLNELDIADVKTVSIAPIYKSSSGSDILGGVTNTFNIKSEVTGNGGVNGGVNGGEECTPDLDPCGSFVCGNVVDSCGDIISCGGACASGSVCSLGTCVLECTADPDPCGSFVCGDVTNSCGNIISCGNCNSTASCSAGTCILNCIPDPDPCGSLVCGNIDDGCGSSVICGNLSGNCAIGFICVVGACELEVSINSGIVDLTWPPGINLFFDSDNLSKTESYTGKFAKFPGSAETRCLPVTDHIFPSDPEIYNKSFIRLGTPNNERTLILTGDNYEIWDSPTCGI